LKIGVRKGRIGFNPRPHTAGDCQHLPDGWHIEIVSIHARTRRATAAAQTISGGQVTLSIPRTRFNLTTSRPVNRIDLT
jgi:hypothetical protein